MSARQHVDRLTQSLLAKAFRGEIVPTEHALAIAEGRTYEPASQLLAKIRDSQSNVKLPSNARKARKTPNTKTR